MSILRRDQRKFPAQKVPYLNRSMDDLFSDLIELKRANCPNWTDESPSDFGVQLLWLQAVMARFMVDHMERLRNNCFLSTALDRESVRRICEYLAYTLAEGSPASVDVTFTLEAGHPEFTISEGTQVATRETSSKPAVTFEVAADRLVGVGESTVTISCTHGKTVANEIIASSNGDTNQRYRLSRRPVVWQSEMVEVFEDGAWQAWTRKDNFVSSGGSDKHFRVAVDADGYFWIEFGDGTNGRIPPRGTNNIRATYRVGGGTAGNVGAGTIIELVSAVQYIESINNAKAANGGTDRETLDHARVFAPASIRTQGRGVTVGDIEYLCESYQSTKHGQIAQAKAIENGGFGVNVMIVPATGGLPSADLKTELQTYLNAQIRKPVCVAVYTIDPIYVYVDVTATIHTLPNYSPSAVIAEVRRRLSAYLSPVYQDPQTGLFSHDFGRDLHLSDIYAMIDSTQGVDHVTLVAPTSDILIADDEIANIGTLTLTAYDPQGGQSYFQSDADQEELAK